MRVAVVFLYLFLNLFGGSFFIAETESNQHTHASTSFICKNEQVKLPDSKHAKIIIGDFDVDLEEECFNEDDFQDKNTKHFPVNSYMAEGCSFLARSHLFSLNYQEKKFTVSPQICGNSTPIYLTNRVLRL
ncbi:MAG: hypothetical protein EOP53_01045 [Sphingobacteriales bacterium]|nr:MAG: hypothetical protein EOP53_01045 [Sphingobacteriales bacterium]